jgi:hypothetical protein
MTYQTRPALGGHGTFVVDDTNRVVLLADHAIAARCAVLLDRHGLADVPDNCAELAP